MQYLQITAKKIIKNNNTRLILFLISLAIFVFLRVFQITQNLNLFGDFGRDLFILQDWSNNLFKPPLLGPQTSAISFNQSAIYYYYLFPFFVLLNHSVYSTLIASIFLYLVVFVWFWWWYRKKTNWQWGLIALVFLIAIHPQFILQQRYVWNPSLISPFLLLNFWAWIEFQKSKKNLWIWIMASTLAASASLNFSILPTVFVFLVIFSWQERSNIFNILKLLFFGLVAGFLTNLPTLLFELRHNFLLSKTLLTTEVLQQDSLISRKISMLISNLVQPIYGSFNTVIIFSLFVAFLSSLILFKNLVKMNKTQKEIYKFSFLMFVGSSILLLLSPLTVHGHYIFGALTFLLISIISLPKKMVVTLLIVSTFLYIQPNYINLYQKKAPHTVKEKTKCIQTFCNNRLNQSKNNNPIFVNTNSSSHNHQSLEYIYLLKEFGCDAIDTQEFNATPTNEMLVVADDATFENGKTSYYELSQFGEAILVDSLECKNNLSLFYLTK